MTLNGPQILRYEDDFDLLENSREVVKVNSWNTEGPLFWSQEIEQNKDPRKAIKKIMERLQELSIYDKRLTRYIFLAMEALDRTY